MNGKRGRPWGRLVGESREINELAILLRGHVENSGLTISELAGRIAPAFQQRGKNPPAITTISRRLSGRYLNNDGQLVEALIEVCVPEGDRGDVLETAKHLLNAARYRPTPVADPSTPDGVVGVSELARLLAQISSFQEQHLQNMRELEIAHEARLRAELEVVRLTGRQPAFVDHSEPPPEPIEAVVPGISSRGDVKAETANHGRTLDARDPELEALSTELKHRCQNEDYVAALLRESVDSVIDGQRTGRLTIAELMKSEKAYLGTRITHTIQHALGIEEGSRLDVSIVGVEADIKFSLSQRWMIQAELIGEIVVLVSLDETNGHFSLGTLRVTEEILSGGRNRDGKRVITHAGRERILWLFHDARMTPNVFTRLSPDDLDAVVSKATGHARLLELFRRVQNQPIEGSALRTVTMQADYGKRVREARRQLEPEGIAVLGYYSTDVLKSLGLPELKPHEYISVRLARVDPKTTDRPTYVNEQGAWAVARPEDPAEPVGSLFGPTQR